MTDDLISRQKAIEALMDALNDVGVLDAEDINTVFQMLPPSQPKIVKCKDCKHFVRDDIEEYTPYGFYNTYFRAFCDKHWDNEQGEFIDVKTDDFCSYAERREVTT